MVYCVTMDVLTVCKLKVIVTKVLNNTFLVVVENVNCGVPLLNLMVRFIKAIVTKVV